MRKKYKKINVDIICMRNWWIPKRMTLSYDSLWWEKYNSDVLNTSC